MPGYLPAASRGKLKGACALALAGLLLVACASDTAGIGSSPYEPPRIAQDSGRSPAETQLARADTTKVQSGGSPAAFPIVLAGAAALYLLIKGGELAVDAVDGPTVYSYLGEEDRRLAAEAYARAYEAPSGSTVAWRNETAGAKGYVTATGPRYSASGRSCRSFRHVFWNGTFGSLSNDVACLSDEEGWTLSSAELG